MAKIITDNQHYYDIAEAIRTKNETETLYKPSEMAAAILEIQGGGADLNFEIVGGTAQPSSPKENTIWVNTSVDVPYWGFFAEEPVSADEGTVAIIVKTDNPSVSFNAINNDDNVLMVYAYVAKQYVSGSWNPVPSAIYQSGEWVDLYVWLFKEGNAELVEKWSAAYQSGNTANVVSITPECIQITTNSYSYAAMRAHCRFDVTDINTLYFDVLVSANDSTIYYASVGLIASASSDVGAQSWVKSTNISTFGTRHTVAIDVSDQTGIFYAAIRSFLYTGKVYCYNVWGDVK